MSTSIIINNVEYPAEISGVLQNPKWDRRDTKSITLEMTHDQAVSLFVDGLAWSIKQVNTYPVLMSRASLRAKRILRRRPLTTRTTASPGASRTTVMAQ